MKSELAEAGGRQAAGDTSVSDGRKSVGQRFRQNNNRGRERECVSGKESESSPGWPTFSPSNSQKRLRDSSVVVHNPHAGLKSIPVLNWIETVRERRDHTIEPSNRMLV